LLAGRALADRMHGEETFITNDDHDEDALRGNGNLKLLRTPSAGLDHMGYLNFAFSTECSKKFPDNLFGSRKGS